MKTRLLLFLLTLSLSTKAQSTLGFYFHGFLPTDELKENASEIWGGGFGLEGAFNVKQSPLYFGGQLDFTRFGSEMREGYHGPDLGEVRYRRQFEMHRILGLARIKPDCGVGFYPYFDFHFGTGIIMTRSVIREEYWDEPFDNFIDQSQWTVMYGFSVGYEFFLSDHIILDLHVRRMESGKVEYLTPSSVSYDATADSYNLTLHDSRFSNFNFGFGFNFFITDMLHETLGVIVSELR